MSSRLTCSWVFLVFFLAINFSVLSPLTLSAQEESGTGRKVTAKVTPQYPPLCRTLRISGSVKVEALVEPNGTVKSIAIKGGHPVLVEAAQNAVRQWKWEPASRDTHET